MPRRWSKHRRRQFECLEARQLLAADIVINEVHYDPPDKTQFAEYIELVNHSDRSVDLSEWYFSSAIEYAFPRNTSLAPGDFLVVAQDPGVLRSDFGQQAFGPWKGQLRNAGERIELRDAHGKLIDMVDYRRGFPWPTVGDEPGHSIELIHPSLDNSLGGNWRRAGTEADAPASLVPTGATWKYFPGTEEPSSPRSAWRAVDFDDAHWKTGASPVGYGDGHVATRLNMRNNYSTLYLRKTFDVEDASAIHALHLAAQFDDGINVWINGRHLVRQNVARTEASYRSTAERALENLEFVEFELDSPESWLVDGTNVVAVQLLNASRGNSSDAWFDAELRLTQGGNHSPGRANTINATNAAPAIRKVRHGEGAIRSQQAVTISAQVTDPQGVEAVLLEYQVVRPGDYFGRYLKKTGNQERLNPRYDDPREWTSLPMLMSDQPNVFAATIPAEVQQHRHLIRYRITVQDTLDATVRVPYVDDPQHNFAYFVYDEVPSWTGSARPGREPEVSYNFDDLGSIATYHLLTTHEYHQDSQHIPDAKTSSYSGSDYRWPGTMVYDGKVYDNIRYRARGGVWRYAMGKNMWKFDFNRGHGFQARDDYGKEYQEAWDKLNFSAVIQQGDYLHRGEQGLFESVGFKLFNLAGVESANTHFVHFRIVDGEHERGSDQYTGDFRGLYLAIEQPDGRMLEEHGLPDGNLYKIEGHRGSANNQGPTQPTDGSDVTDFIRSYRNGTPSPDWWRENLDLEKYYSYRTIVEGIHHYDIAYGKNYFYYHNPVTDKFSVHPWDLDLTWADNMYGSGRHDFVAKVAENDAFRIDYENRVRELMDLLYNAEQTGLLIDEFANMIYTPDEPSWVDADRAMWDFNPILASSHVNSRKAGTGRFYGRSRTDDFAGMIHLMKEYVDRRTRFFHRQFDTDDQIPETPQLQYLGENNFPTNGLRFESSAFRDPQGDNTFAAMRWRIAEITDPSTGPRDGIEPHYEINANYETADLSQFHSTWTPPINLLAGQRYRVRAKVQDTAGHWSHWSAPIEFTTGQPLPSRLRDSLRISEIHYHPANPSPEEQAAGFTDQDDFEFLELINIGQATLDLTDTALIRTMRDGQSHGVDFRFLNGKVTTLPPGERVVVVEDEAAFAVRYGDDVPVAGRWSGKLSNAGEQLTLVDGGDVILTFSYDDLWHPSTDGDGYSLEAVNPRETAASALGEANAWIPSRAIGGSPGRGPVLGDFDGNDEIDAADIDLLFGAITDDPVPAQFDLTQDQVVDAQDVDLLLHELLMTKRGDADLDGVVGFSDFLRLSNAFGRSNVGWAQGDFNGDGKVDFADFLLLSSNYG